MKNKQKCFRRAAGVFDKVFVVHDSCAECCEFLAICYNVAFNTAAAYG